MLVIHLVLPELFYDIFYVAVISKISGSHLQSWSDYGSYISLFIPIWWAWSMVTFYATRFDTDDVLHRLLIFVQMFGISELFFCFLFSFLLSLS